MIPKKFKTCPSCSATVRADRLHQHIQRVHTGVSATQSTPICDYCRKHFSSTSLLAHQKVCKRQLNPSVITVFKKSAADIFAGLSIVKMQISTDSAIQVSARATRKSTSGPSRKHSATVLKYTQCPKCEVRIRIERLENHLARCPTAKLKDLPTPRALKRPVGKLALCPHCNVKVNENKLKKHIAKMHSRVIAARVGKYQRNKIRGTDSSSSFRPHIVYNTPPKRGSHGDGRHRR